MLYYFGNKMSYCTYSLLHLILHIVNLSLFFTNAQAQRLHRPFNNSVTAIFVFGDSTVDPGNNNYIPTVVKSNFPPYGRDFANHIPTGRFTNGQLVTDFIASYVGVKQFVPPYLDPTLSIQELMTGVSFASASSGFDPLTAISAGVITIEKQMEYFREYKTRVELAIGKERAKTLIENAAIFVSAGTNDLAITYFGSTIRRRSYTLSAYQQFLVQNVQQFIQELLEEGAKTIGIVGTPPIGCLPALISINSDDAFHHRKCIETLSSAARDYNQLLQKKLKVLQTSSGPNVNILYEDIYTPFMDLIQRHKNFGFDKIDVGCCGTGLLEVSILCNTKSPVCADPSKYVFWDSIHPTERTYYIVFQSLRSKIDLYLKEKQR